MEDGLDRKGEDTSGQGARPSRLVVSGDQPPSPGPLVFPGTIEVSGPLPGGLSIWAGENLESRVTLDLLEATAKGDIRCLEGLVGHGGAQVRAGRDIAARFIQNCRVAARGSVTVGAALSNSRVYSLGTVEVAGSLAGGECYAVHGIRTAVLGSEAGRPTLVHAGSDFTVQQELDMANEKLRVLAYRLSKTREEAVRIPVVGLAAILEQGAREEAALKAEIAALVVALDADENAEVLVTSAVLPGVTVEICRASLRIDRALGPSRFRLDRASGTIGVTAL